jgi:hypothetical protein
MAEGLGFDRERPDTRLVPAFIVVALALLAGCDGDTLYDRASPDLVPPSVAILAPEAGDDVLAGQAVPIRVVAGDEDGVTSLEIRVSGSFTAAISRAYDPPLPVVEVDTTVTVPAEAEGPAIVSATAINTQGGVAEAEPIQINVALVDSIAPNVRIRVRGLLNEGLDTVQVPTTDRLRLELRDSLLVDVTALDNAGGSGIRLVGVSAVVASSTRTDTLALTLSRDLGVAQPDTVEEAFTIAPPFADSLNLPDSMDIEIYGWTVDAGGTCSVAIADVRDDTFRCDEATYGSQTVTVGTVVPTPHSVIAVTGRGKKLQEAGTIADLLVDTLRARAYLSNLSKPVQQQGQHVPAHELHVGSRRPRGVGTVGLGVEHRRGHALRRKLGWNQHLIRVRQGHPPRGPGQAIGDAEHAALRGAQGQRADRGRAQALRRQLHRLQ